MKRLTALALTIVVLLLLFLTGCADTKQNGDRLQDKLNTKQLPETQEPAQTDLPDTTKTSPALGRLPLLTIITRHCIHFPTLLGEKGERQCKSF